MPAELLIFDMDGVLVDSELLFNATFAAHLRPLGLDWTPEQTRANLSGRSMPDCITRLAEVWGVTVPSGFTEALEADALARMATALQPISHVHAAIAALPHPRCLASSSSPARIDASLAAVGLEDAFPASRRFSASHVSRGKPDPELFQYAALQCGAAPQGCVVIEDSPLGAQAAVAAGMRVLGFAQGASDGGAALVRAGAVVFSDMRSLPAMVAAVGG